MLLCSELTWNDKYNEAFDNSGNRNSIESTYCTSSSTIADAANNLYYGCNAWYASDNFDNISTTGTVQNDSSSNTYLNNYKYYYLHNTSYIFIQFYIHNS